MRTGRAWEAFLVVLLRLSLSRAQLNATEGNVVVRLRAGTVGTLSLAAMVCLLPGWAIASLSRQQAGGTDSNTSGGAASAVPAMASKRERAAALSAEVATLRHQLERLEARIAALEAAGDDVAGVLTSPGVTVATAATGGLLANHSPRIAPGPRAAGPVPVAAVAAQDPALIGSNVKVGGYGSFRFDGGDSGITESMTLRRFVTTFDAEVSPRFRAYAEVEYERFSEIEIERSVSAEAGGLKFEQEIEGTNGSEIALEQAWGEYRVTDALAIRFGAVLPPVGRFNIRHDDNLWNYPKRPLIDREAKVLPAPAAWTEMGIGVNGEVEIGDTVISYEAYLLNGVTLDSKIEQKLQTRSPKRNKIEFEAIISPTSGAFDGSNAADALAGRIQISPALGTEIAISGYVGEYTPGFLDRGASMYTLGFDGVHRLGPVRLEGEFLYTRFGNLTRVLNDIAAVALNKSAETSSSETANLESEIEIEVKGLSEERYGFWLDFGAPIALRPGFLGFAEPQLIPSIRYERVWYGNELQEFDFSAGTVTGLQLGDRQQDRLMVGFAFRTSPLAVLHFFYERNHAIEGELIAPQVGSKTTHGFVFGLALGF